MTVVDGTLVVSWWGLPPELGGASGEGVKVEVNVTGEWVEVGRANGHTLDPPQSTTGENFTIHLRVSNCLIHKSPQPPSRLLCYTLKEMRDFQKIQLCMQPKN